MLYVQNKRMFLLARVLECRLKRYKKKKKTTDYTLRGRWRPLFKRGDEQNNTRVNWLKRRKEESE